MKHTKFGKLRYIICALLSLCLVLPLAACGGGDDKGEKTAKLTVAPTTVTVAAGDTASIQATLTNISGEVTWTSSNNAVATVAVKNPDTTTRIATISGVAEGTATITAKAGGKTATCTVTVTGGGEGGGDERPEPTSVGYSGEESFTSGWRYWTSGPEVTASTYSDDNELHLSYASATSIMFFYVQAFFKDKYADVTHNVAFTFVSPVAGAIQVCGQRKEVEAGENEISITDWHGDSTITVQFGDPQGYSSESGLLYDESGAALDFVIKDIVITAPNVTAELKAPSFEINNENVITITDSGNTPADVGRYELGFFANEDDELPSGTVVVTNGAAIDLSTVSAGAYTVKLRAVNDSLTVISSEWSTVTATITSSNSKTYLPFNAGQPAADTWAQWVGEGASLAADGSIYMEDGDIYVVGLTNSTWNTYGCQIKYASSKAITAISMKVRCSANAGWVGFSAGGNFELTAVADEDYYEATVSITDINTTYLIICLAGNEGEPNKGAGSALNGNITLYDIEFTFAE